MGSGLVSSRLRYFHSRTCENLEEKVGGPLISDESRGKSVFQVQELELEVGERTRSSRRERVRSILRRQSR